MAKRNAKSPAILLIHWNLAEAEPHQKSLQRAGFNPKVLRPGATPSLRQIGKDPPDALVIDLNRMPSHGRAVATALRQQKTTRYVPLVFINGDPDKTAKIKEAFPDAAFADWGSIGSALRSAIASPPTNPVVPGTMSGYSGTPLPKKLGIKPGKVVLMISPPQGFEEKISPPPEGARFSRTARSADLILMFNKNRAQFEGRLESASAKMNDGAGLWIIWPKKASGMQTDLSERVVRQVGLDSGLVDYKICAVDEIWSGLLFARRKQPAQQESG